jgi:hypothetical protein
MNEKHFLLYVLFSNFEAKQRGYLGNVPFLQPSKLAEKMLSVQKDFDFNPEGLISQSLLPFHLRDGVLISDLLADVVLNIESFFSGILRAELVHLGLLKIKYNKYYNIID